MTCEVAVMNKYGVALAADSAATFGRGQKVYYAAEKLFCISQVPPVGVMISGSAELMDMPWEIIIKTYTQQRQAHPFERLEQYVEDFFRFVEQSEALFPPALQQTWFREAVRRYWKETFLEPLATPAGAPRKRRRAGGAAQALHRILARETAAWRRLPMLELGAVYGDRVLAEYAPVLAALEKELFHPLGLKQDFADKFRAAVGAMYMHTWVHPGDGSGIVFAGMGEAEPFPGLQEFQVDSIAAGRLRAVRLGEARITREVTAIVAPFGVTEMVDIFYRGIQPELEESLYAIIGRNLAHHRPDAPGWPAGETARLVEQIRKAFTDGIVRKYQSPLIAAVEVLPRQGLATMAEALVNLTALKLRMSVETVETVGGAVHVALLSRGDGFVWVRRPNSAREAAEPGG